MREPISIDIINCDCSGLVIHSEKDSRDFLLLKKSHGGYSCIDLSSGFNVSYLRFSMADSSLKGKFTLIPVMEYYNSLGEYLDDVVVGCERLGISLPANNKRDS